MTFMKIISGGQTGADRAALDAALELHFPCGGWCPQGRLADDGPLPECYPLEELANGGYRQRTIKNIESSDATAVFYFGRPVGGTELTLVQCVRLHKPYQLVDAAEIDARRAGEMLKAFIDGHGVSVLNVAGPSERRNPGTHTYVHQAVVSLLEANGVGV